MSIIVYKMFIKLIEPTILRSLSKHPTKRYCVFAKVFWKCRCIIGERFWNMAWCQNTQTPNLYYNIFLILLVSLNCSIDRKVEELYFWLGSIFYLWSGFIQSHDNKVIGGFYLIVLIRLLLPFDFMFCLSRIVRGGGGIFAYM